MLDIRSLIFILVLQRLLQAAALLYLWRTHKNFPPARDWALGSLMVAAGVLMVGLRDMVPPFVSIVAGNAAILGGAMVFDAGILRACDKAPPWRTGLALLVAATLSLNWYTFETPSFAARMAIFSALVVIYDMASVLIGWRTSRGPLPTTQRLVFGLLVVESLVTAWRCVDMIQLGSNDVFAPSTAGLWFVIGSIAITFLAAAVLTNLTSQRLRIELDHAAQHDPLTGVMNRRAFKDVAVREWSRTTRHGQPLTALMFDIDHFKQLNDEHGHAAGDAVLIVVANAIRAGLRNEDVMCRCGGEEFAAFLPETSAASAESIAERLRAAIARMHVVYADINLSVTVSIGVAERGSADASWEHLMVAADKALYLAKKQGRNRVVRFQPRAVETVPQPLAVA